MQNVQSSHHRNGWWFINNHEITGLVLKFKVNVTLRTVVVIIYKIADVNKKQRFDYSKHEAIGHNWTRACSQGDQNWFGSIVFTAICQSSTGYYAKKHFKAQSVDF